MKNQYLILAIVMVSMFCSSMIYSTPINPYINTVTPSQNAVSVIKSSNITIVFTQDMNPSTINNANIKVFGYQTGLLPVTIDYNPVSKTANINPNQDLKAGEKICVTLTSGIRNLANESINPFVFTFYVRAIGGNGNFTRSSFIINDNHSNIRSGDIDNDGDLDLLLMNKIFTNNGNGIFSYNTELSIIGSSELVDIDNDGDLDILIQTDTIINFFINNGNLNLILSSSIPGTYNTAGDLNGDGYLDLVNFTTSTNLEILRNVNGLYTQDNSFQLTTGCSLGNYNDDVIVDDLDNDGDLDIVAINGIATGNSISFHELCRNYYKLTNNGSGNFIPGIIYNSYIGNTSIWVYSAGGSKSADFTGNGFVDLVSPLHQLINNTNGTFSLSSSLFGFSNSLIADINGDGNLDLLSVGVFTPLFRQINNSNGNLTLLDIDEYRYSRGSASGDFDNDGDIDIAISDFYSHNVAILLNGDIPLPVELSSFTSETETNNVTLNWTTSSEENNTGYDIEKTMFNVQSSMFNENWSKGGFINDNGNTNNMSNYTFTDKNLQSGKYKYRLKQTDFNGNFKYYELSNEVTIGVPDKFYLSQNYPNPFNPSTNLGFGISESGYVSLKVYDSQGKEVATLVNENKEPGYYYILFDGSKLSSGVYYYRLESKGFSQIKRMMLLK